jgi:Mg-chelatase subunit ChlD
MTQGGKMKKFCRIETNVFIPFLIIFVLLVTACGSGGGDASGANNPDNNPDSNAQSEVPTIGVTLNSLSTEACPDVKIYASFYDDNNRVIEDNPALSVRVFEDGVEQVNNIDLTWLADAQDAISVVLAMDYSLSMVNGDNSEEEMKKAVKEFVTLMKPEDKAAIIKFFYTPQVMADLTSDQDALNSAIDTPPTSNMYTNIYDTLYTAVDLLSAETGPVAIILISDGGHAMTQADGFLSPEEYAQQDGLTFEGHTKEEALAHANDYNVPVFSIGYKSIQVSHEEIKEIAARTGGGYYSATDASALENIYGSLFHSLEGNQHQIVYTSDTADAQEHTIRIEAEYNGLSGASENLNVILCPAP